MDRYHTVCFVCNSHLMYLEDSVDDEGNPVRVCPNCGALATSGNVDQKQFDEWNKELLR